MIGEGFSPAGEIFSAGDTGHKPKVTPKEATLWVRSETLQRIYIRTVPYTKTYYDLVKMRWVTDSDIDLEDLREKTLGMYHADSADDLYGKITAISQKGRA